ncbi:MAG TPA: DinB family protein [Candidatus Acidoferrales bacterium]|nr:DinB family protein [Candidatus Acidoferrales bacterium]
MRETIAKFELVLATAPRRLVDISEADAGRKPDSKRWSKKEVLGHLIDSAANNHQRFVRAQFVARIDLPTYEQEVWVERQGYASEPWPDLVNLWLLLNRHLLHVVRAMPDEALGHEISIAGRPAVTLEAVIVDYLSHMDNHLAQIYA